MPQRRVKYVLHGLHYVAGTLNVLNVCSQYNHSPWGLHKIVQTCTLQRLSHDISDRELQLILIVYLKWCNHFCDNFNNHQILSF